MDWNSSDNESEHREKILLEPGQLSKKEETVISLHAIDGKKSLATFKLVGLLQGMPVNILWVYTLILNIGRVDRDIVRYLLFFFSC